MDIEKQKKRIIDISKKLNHAHIGSSLTALPVLMEIFKCKIGANYF